MHKQRIPHIFVPILIDCYMNGSERPTANLLSDHILIYSVFSSAVILAESVLRSSIECFLINCVNNCSSEVQLVLTLTGRRAIGLRRWCLCGLSKDGVDLWRLVIAA
jgi:hypothetical protein